MNKSDQKPAYKIVAAQGEGAMSLDVEITWCDEARRLFESAKEECPRSSLEYSAAKHELAHQHS